MLQLAAIRYTQDSNAQSPRYCSRLRQILIIVSWPQSDASSRFPV